MRHPIPVAFLALLVLPGGRASVHVPMALVVRVSSGAVAAQVAGLPNPSRFTAVQGKDHSIHLTWLPVRGASGYLLLGPGLPKTGVNVMGLEFDVKKIPAGLQRWRIGTVTPEGNTGPLKDFSIVELVVRAQ